MNTTSHSGNDGLLHGGLKASARRYPDHPACTYLSESISYAELNRRSDQLAGWLVGRGVQRGDRVGIYMPKSIDTPVALYGILKSGAAYVPLDPSAPVARTNAICADCDIRFLISSHAQRRKLRQLIDESDTVRHVVGLTEETPSNVSFTSWDVIRNMSAEPAKQPVAREDLAYILFTSGSTGTPKGMMHTHRSGTCFSDWAVDEFELTGRDRLSNHAPLHFDLSVMDYFSASSVGATTVIVPEEYTKLPASYSSLIEEQQISVLYTVPFALTQLLLHGALEQRDFSRLRLALFAGEPFAAVYLRALMKMLPHVTFVNLYGPAETNAVTFYVVPEPPLASDSIPIGKLTPFAHGVVVDADDSPVAQGEAGELLIRSPSLMTGYWRQEELTQQSLHVPGPPSEGAYYRSGDLVETLHDGNLRFLGRRDRQVKIRGYRVELDEIELALTALDAVEEGAAYVVEVAPGVKEVRAEATLRLAEASESDLMRSLKRALPWYALPAVLTTRTAFPRTTTGKIDRRSLQLAAQESLDRTGHTRQIPEATPEVRKEQM